MADLDISIVIPAFNEADNIPPLFERLEKLFASKALSTLTSEIIIIDDGSTDATWEAICCELKRGKLPLSPYQLSRNKGQSHAFLFGFSRAKGRWIATMDADMQNDPLDLCLLMQKTGQFDCIIGRRSIRQDVMWRRWLSRLANRTRRWLIDDGTYDTCCSLKLFLRECTYTLPHFRGVHRFFPAYFRMAGYRIGETAVSHLPRMRGVSKYSFWSRGFSVFFDFLATAWLFRRTTADER